MKVCDRCKKPLDTNQESKLAGKKFELCTACAEYISNHIERFQPKSGFSKLGEMFK